MQTRTLRQTITLGRVLLLAALLCAADRLTATPARAQFVSVAHAGIARNADDPRTLAATAFAVTVNPDETAAGGFLFIPETDDEVLVAYHVQVDRGTVLLDESGAAAGVALEGSAMQLFMTGKVKGDQFANARPVPTTLFVSDSEIEVAFDLRDGLETIRLIMEGGLNFYLHKLPARIGLLAIGEPFQYAALVWPDGTATGRLSAELREDDETVNVDVEIAAAEFELRGLNATVFGEGVAHVSSGGSTCVGEARFEFQGYRPQFYLRTTDVTGGPTPDNAFAVEVADCCEARAISTLRTLVTVQALYRDVDKDGDGG